MYQTKNGIYTLIGLNNCEWNDEAGAWDVMDPEQTATVVPERLADGKIFFQYQWNRWTRYLRACWQQCGMRCAIGSA